MPRHFLLPFLLRVELNSTVERLRLFYKPCVDRTAIEHDLQVLLVPGALTDRDLERRIFGFEKRFRNYAAYYPLGLWAPGLAITPEMRNLTEIYLPTSEIRRAFNRLFLIALRFKPFPGASLVHRAAGWLDIVQGFHALSDIPNPSSLLARLLAAEDLRRVFLFANFMPSCYGGRFGRYPGQTEFLRRWLKESHPRFKDGIRCLDAACGSGEGTYELALLLCECGFRPDSMEVSGTTLEPFELFAAAHCYVPQDLPRTAAYRRQVSRLFECGAAERIAFTLANLADQDFAQDWKEYDVILCNGILGGPFFHDRQELPIMVEKLAGLLRPGGILMAANRFHGGWKRMAEDEMLRSLLAECGLRILQLTEGVAGEKP